MRLKNSSYNVVFNVLQLVITTILTFITRTLFIRYLGKEYLGLDGLFTNILSMLSLTDLGIGTAISFSLYKPLAEHDDAKVSILMSFYKKIYIIIASIVLIIGLVLIPLLPIFTKGFTGEHLYIYYLIYLINTVFSYLLTYKEALIIADQHEHKLFWNRIVCVIVMYTSQIIILITTKNFLYYLIAMFISCFARNIINNLYVTKIYSNISFSTKEKLDSDTKNTIIQNTKNMFISKIGDYLLNGTDNIIISSINIVLTGIYSNYLAIIGIMQTLMNTIYNGVTASFGNVIAVEDKDIQESVFKKSTFICFLISGYITIELIFLFNPFIAIWAGESYVVEFWLSIIIAINYYFYCNYVSLHTLKVASGQYKADRYVPLIQATVNIVLSILLGYFMGLAGVVLGTFISYITVGLLFRPILLIKNVFNKSAISYFINQIKYYITIGIVFVINFIIFRFVSLDSSLLLIIIKGLIISLVYSIIIIVLYRRDDSFMYIISLLKTKLQKKESKA